MDGVVVERERERFGTKRTGRKPVSLLFVLFELTAAFSLAEPRNPVRKIEFVTVLGESVYEEFSDWSEGAGLSRGLYK